VTLTDSRAIRWFAPLAVVAALLAVAGARASLAGAAPSQPRVSAQQLLAKVTHSKVDSLSGVVQTTSGLSLPSLPAQPNAGALTSLLSGTQTSAVSIDGVNRQRIDVLDPASQGRILHNQNDVLAWSSVTNKVIHTQLPALPSLPTSQVGGLVGTPQALAQQLMAAVDKNTLLSVGPATSVAGRPAQVLRLVPNSADSLIGQANVFVDSLTGMALRTTVAARGQAQPALDVAFKSLKLGTPAAGIFDSLTAVTGTQADAANTADAANGSGASGLAGLPAGGLLSNLPAGSVLSNVPVANLLGSLPVSSLPVSSLPVGSLTGGSLPTGNLLGNTVTGGLLNNMLGGLLGGLPAGVPDAILGALPGALSGNLIPAGAIPTGALPKGLIPQGGLQGVVPQGIVPNGVLKGVVPKGILPQDALPTSALPVGSLPDLSTLTNPQSALGMLGSGFTAVSELRGLVPAGADQQLQSMLSGSPTVSGAFGTGHLLVTQLLSMLVTKDGGVFAGPVTPQALLRTVSANGHD
jgi:hypothetical protein